MTHTDYRTLLDVIFMQCSFRTLTFMYFIVIFFVLSVLVVLFRPGLYHYVLSVGLAVENFVVMPLNILA